MKRKIVALTLAGMLSLGVVGCGQQQQQQTEPVKTEVQNKTEEKVQQVESTIKWTDAANAEEAAKGAGFEKFGVPGEVEAGAKFENPKFAYSGGVAQATYEKDGTTLIIRKANGKHETALSGDRDLTKLANKWTKSYEGLDVTLYGVANGAATVMTWTEGTADYYVELKGSGDAEVSIDSDDCAKVVKAVKEANANQEQKTEQQSEQKQETTNNNANNNANSNTNTNTNSESGDGGSNGDGMAVTISREGAIAIACDQAGAGGQAKGEALNINCSDIIEGGGTKYYKVSFDLGDVHYEYTVDAIDGHASGMQTFNGTQQLLDENGEPVEGTEESVD